MLVGSPKHCHRALRVRSRLFGLEIIDLLAVFAIAYPLAVGMGAFYGGVLAVVLAIALRLIKWGKLPEYLQDLVLFGVLVEHHPVLGAADKAPPYPRERARNAS